MSKISSLFTRGQNRIQKVEAPITLDAQQKDIVYSTADNIIVVAGAGSGKTRVLTERVKHLVDIGVPPCNIVAITFTNMAAEEMRERLKDIDCIGDAFIGTIHSFANKLMQLSDEEYTLYNDDLDNQYHEELIAKYCDFLSFSKFLKYKDLRNAADLGLVSEREVDSFLEASESAELRFLERTAKEVDDYIALAEKSDNPEDFKYRESVGTLCRDHNVIDFDQLLKMANEYFKSIGAHVEHLLVDELQDVGHLEFSFIESLSAQNHFFVGDDWQSIYGFKGANVNIFLRLVEDSDFTTYYLTNNYRNSTSILDTAATVISQVSNKISKNITPVRKEEGSVTISTRNKLDKYLDMIAETETEYKDWFILTRTNKEMFAVVERCREFGVPCMTFKREGMTLAEMARNMNHNSVKVLTVHTAKGLESKKVILYGNFPIQCPSYRLDPEERKVMYVGITRAEDELIILN